ncbi:MAG: FeoB-associated Cys-rich membrane protein [Bacteroidales bacterium]|jgi:hypothetical protein|nr:FeoB-associated Cys-rich membrane protein [Bacteroidales bacterium]
MIQDFLTYITVAAAIAYAVFNLIKTLFSSSGKSGCSSGCGSCGSETAGLKSGKLSISSKQEMMN